MLGHFFQIENLVYYQCELSIAILLLKRQNNILPSWPPCFDSLTNSESVSRICDLPVTGLLPSAKTRKNQIDLVIDFKK